MFEGFAVFLAFLAAVLLLLWLFIALPAQMARDRKRGAVAWVLVSLIGSPLLAILLLAMIGERPSNEQDAP